MIFEPKKDIHTGNLIKALYRNDVKLFDESIDKVVYLSESDYEKIKQNIYQCAYMDVYDLDKWAYFVEKLAEKNIYVDFSEILTRYIEYSSTLDYKLFKALFENTIVNNGFITSFFTMSVLFRFDNSSNWVDGINYNIKDVYARFYEQEINIEDIEKALRNNAYSRNASYHKYLIDIKNYYLIRTEKAVLEDAILETKPIETTKTKTRKI